MSNESPKLFLAPMLGITDVTFRNIYSGYFSGVDGGISPFIKVNQLGEYKLSKLAELNPKLNSEMEVTPQIMCNSAHAFLSIAKPLIALGYNQINWNLGCPSPMSNTKTLGCGLMPEYDLVDQILESVLSNLQIKISVKTRLGLETSADIVKLSSVFNRYPLEFVAVHPRTGKQGYSGAVALDDFEEALRLICHKVYYSGDINSIQDYQNLTARFPGVKGYLIGRGALRDPTLFAKIRGNSFEGSQLLVTFCRFIEDLANAYFNRDFSKKDVLIRVKLLCFYFSEGQIFPRKQVKAIKKAQSVSEVVEVMGAPLQYYD